MKNVHPQQKRQQFAIGIHDPESRTTALLAHCCFLTLPSSSAWSHGALQNHQIPFVNNLSNLLLRFPSPLPKRLPRLDWSASGIPSVWTCVISSSLAARFPARPCNRSKLLLPIVARRAVWANTVTHHARCSHVSSQSAADYSRGAVGCLRLNLVSFMDLPVGE